MNTVAVTRPFLIRVKVCYYIHDRLRYYRPIPCENGEHFHIEYYYEWVNRFCTNCQKITHSTTTCTYELVPSDYFNWYQPNDSDQFPHSDGENSSVGWTTTHESLMSQPHVKEVPNQMEQAEPIQNNKVTLEDVLNNPGDTFMADVSPDPLDKQLNIITTDENGAAGANLMQVQDTKNMETELEGRKINLNVEIKETNTNPLHNEANQGSDGTKRTL